MAIERPVHLGDGAYVSPGRWPGEIVITANHHDPQMASDVVYLNDNAVLMLKHLLNKEEE